MFGLKVALFLAVLFGGMWLVKWTLRKSFNIEKEKKVWFSYNHVNNLHKKIDWGLRIVAMLVMFMVLYLMIFKGYSVAFYMLTFVTFMFIDSSVKAFFQWKYSDQPKQWILTMGEITFLVMVVIIGIIQFDLVNLQF
ncbi:hypothetical protein B481_0189 [Planococcus halocryophilus Or1]|uniref:DUF4181 domain-containing protein n=1 Tax=Planococcus halocryophilus TaxID=1215089 RepID=A0A1C7DSJ6_9BACL|nr:DUF4181 domain-containing protein [Planococcus halocryophilus]ANU14435.1 hypothetical protein BBI08_11380 [Planococcus halocryophilus]EMF48074.1 hypothetical protein B481_0189 [Planococcus halocryophilus Or1]